MPGKIKIVSWIAIIAVLVIVFLIAKLDLFGAEEKDTATAAPATKAAPQATVVKARVAKPTDLQEKIMSRGTVIPNEEVIVTSEVSGKITNIHFEEGDEVSTGELLVSLDDSELTAQLEKARYELSFLETKIERDEVLKDNGGVSIEQFEATRRDLNTKKSDIALIEAQLAKTKIKASFRGKIGLRYVSKGAYIMPSSQIALLVDTDPVKVDFSVPEKYLSRIRVGNEVNFRIEALDRSFEGTIYAIEPKVDEATRTIKLRARGANPDGILLPGVFATVEIVLDQIENALTVPTEAIVPEMTRKKVFLVKNGKATEQTVTTGLRTSTEVEITTGLHEGDTVVTSGLLQIRNGANLKISMFN